MRHPTSAVARPTANENYVLVTATATQSSASLLPLTKRVSDCGCNVLEARLSTLGQDVVIALLAVGSWDAIAKLESSAARLEREDGISVGVVNARFVKPLDRTLLLSQATVVPLIVTMEDHVLTGGFGSAVVEALQEADCQTAVERIGWPDKFVEHGSNVEILRAAYGLAPDDIARRIKDRYRRIKANAIEAEA